MVTIIPVLTILGLIGYFIKKENILLITSILLFAFIIPISVLLGLNIGYFLTSVDYCSEINKYQENNFFPIYGKGLGYYSSCISKENQINLSTARFQLTTSFNNVYNNLNNYVIKNSDSKDSLPLDKRNNDAYKLLLDKYQSNQNIVNGIKLLIEYNNISNVIEPIFNCSQIKQITTFAEKNYCYKNLTSIFLELKFAFIAILFLIPICMGINKLIVVVNPLFDSTKVSLSNI